MPCLYLPAISVGRVLEVIGRERYPRSNGVPVVVDGALIEKE
jgi:hypothetical protein